MNARVIGVLKVGYVSHDLCMHSVAFFPLPLLESRDKERFHVTCYATRARIDAVTERLRACSDDWRSLAGISDELAAQRLREDRIDILVDLGGHTTSNRLLPLRPQAGSCSSNVPGLPGRHGIADNRLSPDRRICRSSGCKRFDKN